jgi:pilus assembly protein TadC
MAIYRLFAKIYPSKVRSKIKSLLSYSSIKVDKDRFIGFLNVTSLLLGLMSGFILSFIFEKPFWIFFSGVVILVNVVVYLWIMMVIDQKVKVVEEFLPDALQLMSSNLKAGMTPDRALLLSARPEFGILKEEIDHVSKSVGLGKNISLALLDMSKRVRSKRLVRAVELINSGLGSGGSLGDLLQLTASHLREQSLIDKKIKSSISMYIIFIFSATAMITPILFGLSSFLVEILGQITANIDTSTSTTASLPISISSVSIEPSFIIVFIICFILANSFMASMLLGLIGKGSQRDGIKYFIPMVSLAIPIFFITRFAIKYLLGGLFSF